MTAIIENANAPIIRVDKNLKITVWNDRIAGLTGFGKKDALGENLLDTFIDESSRQSVREVLRL